MFNQDLSRIASEAKEKLKSQVEASNAKESSQDLYAEFRDGFDDEVGTTSFEGQRFLLIRLMKRCWTR